MTASPTDPHRPSPASRGWLAMGAASVLGFGLVAASAASIAGAMPLVDSTTESSVPPISTVSFEEIKGVGVAGSGGIATVATSPAPSPSTAPEVVQAPAPAPQPVAPAPAASPASVDSPASADSAD